MPTVVVDAHTLNTNADTIPLLSLRDFIHENTYLVWKIYPGSIVEDRHPASLGNLLVGSPTPGEEAPKVLELFEAIRALKFASQDSRIKGIIADFSSLHIPSSVSPDPLGLAQIEELGAVIREFSSAKREQLQDPKARVTLAWADSFDSQGAYLLASSFDELYVQPTGGVPLTGLATQVTFFRKLLNWAGIRVHAMARKQYKSMVSPFIEEEELPPAQTQNEADLFGDLNRSMARMIGSARFQDLNPEEAEEKVVEMAKNGPYAAAEALEIGLIDGLRYKREIIESLFSDHEGTGSPDAHSAASASKQPSSEDDSTLPATLSKGKAPQYGQRRLDSPEAPKFKSLHDYNRVNNKVLDRALKDDEIIEVGVVYLNGTIASASASSVIKGLNEVADDDDIRSCILRIDSGGGDVVASESIWDAVRRVKSRKPIVASFGNVSASGGYYAATAASAITAGESTITGSIGVASLRPVITKTFLDRLGIAVQSFFTGATSMSILHEMDDREKARQEKHMDETYDDFLDKVCQGRGMTYKEADSLAGGKVWTGFSAFVACNGDMEADLEEETGTVVTVDAAGESAAADANAAQRPSKSDGAIALKPKQTKRIRIRDLAYEWTTEESSSAAGNRMTLIVRKPEASKRDKTRQKKKTRQRLAGKATIPACLAPHPSSHSRRPARSRNRLRASRWSQSGRHTAVGWSTFSEASTTPPC